MNILPKKRWHVRNKDNITRVRRDEAKAEQEKNEREQRQKLAEREARTNLLREKAKLRVGSDDFVPLSLKTPENELCGHINFFQELEDGHEESNRTNKEHEREKREETEKYEKQIGYLTYLGQDTNEASGTKNWYDVFPDRESCKNEEVNLKSKVKEDPLVIMKKYLPASNFHKASISRPIKTTDKVAKKQQSDHEFSILHGTLQKRKKHKHKSSKRRKSPKFEVVDKRKKLEILRMERISREKEEKRRSDSLLAEMKNKSENGLSEAGTVQRKYNSQFNPDLARQNFI